jgi:hypothetical protein
MAECVIDALWSERVRYSVIEEIVQRYRDYRAAVGGDADTDSARDLLDTFDMGLDAWMDRIGNRQRAFSRYDAPYKAQLVRAGAQAAVDTGVLATATLRRDHTRDTAGMADFKARWLQLPAQHSGLTWERLLLVAGVMDVLPNAWTVEYVTREVGAPGDGPLTPAEVESAIQAAARDIGSTPLALRNAIWRYETKRDRRIGHGPAGTHRVRAGAIASQDI